MYIRAPINDSMSLQGLSQTPPLPDLSAWQDLISFVPPESVQRKVLQKRWGFDWDFHRIEDGVGPVNLDYYPVKVSRLPDIPGLGKVTAEQFLTYIRTNINNFIDKRLTTFSGVDRNEEMLWKSANPLGAVLHLDFHKLFGPKWPLTNVDDGSVVVSEFRPKYWRVYTIWKFRDQGHPVSGVREWGYFAGKNGTHIFYTRAADRLTKSLALPFKELLYSAQNQLWLSLQNSITLFVKNHQGEAEIQTPTANRYDWGLVQGQYWRPTREWIPKP